MKVMTGILLAVFFGFAAMVCHAADSGPRSIVSMGCYSRTALCWVDISGGAVGPASCSSTSIRWAQAEDVNAKATLAMLAAAFTAGKQVRFDVADFCLAQQPESPTLNWFSVIE